MYNGVINVYKEKAFTSHDVVAKLRGILHQKKIGHTGTLDPDATGVLPVCLGNATKLCDILADKSKTYSVVMQLGVVTDTQDMSGKILEDNSDKCIPSKDEITQAIMSFLGDYAQIPPMYSALKVNGKKLCDLAREGIEVERKPRNITINHIDINDIDEKNKTVSMVVDCSKGTYIRTLCHDIGIKLGIGAAMKELVRIRVSDFVIEKAFTLSQIEELCRMNQLENYIISVENVFGNLDTFYTNEETDRLLNNGNKLISSNFTKSSYKTVENDTWIKVCDSGKKFKAIYKYVAGEDEFVPVKMFLE